MVRIKCIAVAFLAVVCGAGIFSNASGYSIRITGGTVSARAATDSTWQTLTDSSVIAAGDSVMGDSASNATIMINSSTSILTKGTHVVTITGDSTQTTISLAQGQLFFKRTEDASAERVVIESRGYIFKPIGTAAAVKIGPKGEPSVAVLKGTMQMVAPSGDMIDVAAGSFGILNSATGKLKTEPLPAKALASLQEWSGVDNAALAAASVAPVVAPVPESGVAPLESSPTPSTPSVPASTPPKSETQAPPTSAPVNTASAAKKAEPKADAEKKSAVEQKPAEQGADKITWQLSVSNVTVDGQQWTRLAISPDIPIWKFGICLDVELFLDADGKFSDKGWNFDENNWSQSLFRKIRYLRFGHENEPLFIKVGGLDNVTLGYGFVVDRFTNMLHYPDQKLLGMQFYLNDISPIGITLQTMVADFMDFQDNGGVVAARLGVKPLKISALPILENLEVAATYATDLNEYAPAKHWKFEGNLRDKNSNGLIDDDFALRTLSAPIVTSASNATLPLDSALFDSVGTVYQVIDTTFRDSTQSYALFGGDIGLPLIKTDFLNLTVYGQAAVVMDSTLWEGNRSYGIGAPGVRLTVGPFLAQVEYRYTQNKFEPGYFGTYYLDKRVQRYPTPVTKSQRLNTVSLNGFYGLLSLNAMDLVVISGNYHYMVAQSGVSDQALELHGGLGSALIGKIPKIKMAEIYFTKADIGKYNDEFFENTPSLYYGYRVGVEISQGAMLVWDARYGYMKNDMNELVPNNNIKIETALTF